MDNMTTSAPGTERPAIERMDSDRRSPGRPRSAKVDEAIIEAVIDLLAGGTTAETLSIEAVAAKAGVGKATIYRRWANREALLVDAVAKIKGQLADLPGTGTRDDLVALLRPSTLATATRDANILPCIVSELHRSPELSRSYRQAMEPRRDQARQVLRAGIESGELRADLDIEMAIAMLFGPLIAQRLLLPREGGTADADVERLVDALWPALAATG
jgi:AcrR family transcriptional regulator